MVASPQAVWTGLTSSGRAREAARRKVRMDTNPRKRPSVVLAKLLKRRMVMAMFRKVVVRE
jgi:hypothetical protein